MEPKPIATPKLHERVMNIFLKDGIPRKAAILDAGCGEGALLNELRKMGYKNLHGTDIEKEKFSADGVEFKKANLNEKIPFNDNSFDFVFSIENLEHLDSPYTAIKEFHRVLRKGGKAIISTPNPNNWYQKLYFLATGGFHGFFAGEPGKKVHVTPIFLWYLKKLIHGMFEIEEVHYHRPMIPFFRFEMPFKNSFFCEGYIVKCRKI
ncbi:class I SAM-dependent methyltransferase [Candidatus Berkelbacteria bacterium]|nr:class I SAM-dependent methyltransferase [Candidatus Berkelbacteria bacterium]